MDYIKEAQNIISSKDGITAAYGYGSSFFHQAGYNSKTVKSMGYLNQLLLKRVLKAMNL